MSQFRSWHETPTSIPSAVDKPPQDTGARLRAARAGVPRGYARLVRIEQAFDVAAPPEAVFAWFADPSLSFANQVKSAIVTPAGPLAAGTTFVVETSRERDVVDGFVVACDPPHRLEHRMWLRRRPESGGAIRLDFRATNRGTRVTGSVETIMPLLLNAASTILAPVLRFQARRGIPKLVAMIESEFRAGRLGSMVTDDSSNRVSPLERDVLLGPPSGADRRAGPG